jgi:hypothetical protein
MQNFSSLLDDIKRMILFEPALPVEMIFKKGNVRLALFRFGKELLVGRDVHSRGLNLQTHSRHAGKRWHYISKRLSGMGQGETDLFDDTLLGADGETIFELVLSKIYIRSRSSALDLFDRPL